MRGPRNRARHLLVRASCIEPVSGVVFAVPDKEQEKAGFVVCADRLLRLYQGHLRRQLQFDHHCNAPI